MARKLRENEATFYPNRGKAGQWIIKVQKDGTQKQFTSCKPGRKGKLEAERKADEWLEKGLTGKDPRVAAAYAEFVESKRKEGKSSEWPVKLESLGRNHILPYLEHKKVSAIVQLDWKGVIDHAAAAKHNGKPLSRKMLENIRSAITGFVAYCDDAGYPIREIKTLEIPEDAPVGKRQIMNRDDIRTLFTVDTTERYGRPLKCWYINAWRLACVMGFRRGEVAGFQRSDYDGERLTVRRSINSRQEVTSGKNGTAHRSPVLPPIAKQIIRDQLDMLKAAGVVSPWLFPKADGTQSVPNDIYRRWLTYRKQHGLTAVTIHEMRHTNISYLQDEVPEQALKHMVGHTKTMDTFGQYGHEVDGEAARTAQEVEDVFRDLIK